MSRNLTAAAIAEITAQNMRPVLFVALQFSSGYLYLWSGYGSIVWNGITWQGVGDLGAISAITEVSDVSAASLNLTLAGVPVSLLGDALTQVRQGNAVIIYQGFLTAAGAIVANPYQAWAGRMDTCTIREGASQTGGPVDTAVITLSCENRLIDLKRARERDYDQQDQQINFPGDNGFQFVPQLQQLNVVWGVATASVPIRTSGAPVNGIGIGGHGKNTSQ